MDQDQKDNTVKLRRNKVEKFVQELHRKYDTVFTNRKFKTAYGDTVTVYGGDYGWWMNTVKETDKLVKLIQKRCCQRAYTGISSNSGQLR